MTTGRQIVMWRGCRYLTNLHLLEQIREGMLWEPIEKAKAERREKRGKTRYPPVNLPEGKGDVREIIARRVGLGSGVTYEKGKAVVEAIDRKMLMGDVKERGKLLRIKLNDESINAAFTIAVMYISRRNEYSVCADDVHSTARRSEQYPDVHPGVGRLRPTGRSFHHDAMPNST